MFGVGCYSTVMWGKMLARVDGGVSHVYAFVFLVVSLCVLSRTAGALLFVISNMPGV